ncbi:MAG TPA: permease [Gemmataceae bacterium]|nr:permease [Gemmataceae bacterium]
MEDIKVFLITFQGIVWEAMPFIILGALIAGILEELVPQELLARILPKQVLPAVMIGGVLGLVFPMCECGIVVVMRRLLRKGLPLSCCVSYMLAGPIVNVVVILSTWVAFKDHKINGVSIGPEMVGLRVGLGFLVACITGLVVHLQEKKYGAAALLTALAMPPRPKEEPKPGLSLAMADQPAGGAEHDHAHNAGHAHHHAKKPLMTRLGNISATAVHDFVDITVFLILGAVLAAFAKLYIRPEQMTELSKDMPFLAIPAMMLLAVLMCLCSEADAFVAASFVELHISAKIAFLVLGPMLDLKLLMMFTRVFKPRLIVTLVICTVLLVLITSMGVHLVYQANGWSGIVSRSSG